MGPSAYACDTCGKSFSRNYHLLRHQRTVHGSDVFHCAACGLRFTRKDSYQRHMRKQHHSVSEQAAQNHPDTEQAIPAEEMEVSDDTNQVGGARDAPEEPSDDCITEEEAIEGNLKKIAISAEDKTKYDPMAFLKSREEKIRSVLKEALVKRRSVKFYLTLQVRFTKTRGDQVEVAEPHFHGKCHIMLKTEDMEEALRVSVMKIVNSLIEYQREGSNWTLDKVLGVNIHIVTYKPLKGSSYIPLPAKLAKKKAIVNVKNKDQKCFMWSVLVALHPTCGHHAHPNRVTNYSPYIDELDFTDISFPIRVADVPKFEKKNNISINVFGYEQQAVYPLHLTKERDLRHVDLLVIAKGTEAHYCWIKNFNRLMSDQNNDRNQYYFCHYCLHGYTKQKLLDKHLPYCQVHGAQRTEMPGEEDKWLKYTDVSKQLKVSYVVYADFESILERNYGCQPNPEKSSTIRLARHVPSGFTYKIVGVTDELTEDHVTYRGPNTADVFVDHMVKLEERLLHVLYNPKPLQMTDADEKSFREATSCSICGEHLDGEAVRDHCHVTGKFRGAAHNVCNLNLRQRLRIPVFFHNLRGYDAHIIMTAIGKMKHKKLSCIPQNHEKYISFSLGKLDFVDTFQFMSTSLDKLVTNLAEKDLSKFRHLQSYVRTTHPGNEGIKISLLSRKGVYPYRYMNSFNRFKEIALPSRTAFYNDLTEKHISEEDYCHAETVWDVLKIQTLGQYHDLYMETDVHLLADVFENFRTLCLTIYGLDPAHFYTAPGLAWQAALKMTEVELELFTDPDMHLFIEKGLRGGVAMISQRYAKSNHKDVPGYEVTQPNSHVIYLDANNLYGHSMCQPLPVQDFRWLDEEDIECLSVSQVPEDSEEGYILEVDLTYPDELHDLHNDYPLAPETFTIQPEMLSSYQRALLKDLDMKDTRCTKLVPNLYNKTNYVVHYKNLQLYLSLGMRMTKVHKVLAFRQSPWLKPYIDFNTDKRKQAKNEFEKDFFKLMNNSVFGKTMENLRKRVDIQLVHQKKRLMKLSAKPGFKAFKIFSHDLASVELQKQKLVLNRPIYVGFTILDLSKTLMYNFHYNYMKRRYGSDTRLLFTDTDSLCYEVQTLDIYTDMADNKDLFDFSGYPKDHFLYDTTNKKVIGKMKDETASVPIREFVGLRPKMYSFIHGEEEKRTAKGVSKAVIKTKLRHALYTKCLFNRETQMESMNLFRTDRHEIYTVRLNKTTLSAYDDKRYILPDGVHTLAHGHWRIR